MHFKKFLIKDYITVFIIHIMNRKALKECFLKDYGWIIYVQADFKLA